MLITLLLWAYLLPLGWLYGRLTLYLLAKTFRLEDETPSFALTWLAGMTAISTLATSLSLFIKLALAAQLIVLAGGLFILIWQWRTQRLRLSLPSCHPLGYVLAALLFLTVIEISTHTPGNPDTGLYHAQTIRWIETFPVVPGLGNLHSRLAYNSSWLTLNALFSFAFLGGQSYHPLPGLIVLVACYQFLRRGLRLLPLSILFAPLVKGGMSRQRQGGLKLPPANTLQDPNSPLVSPILQPHRIDGRRSAGGSDYLRLLFIPLAFFLLASELSSPGTDLPAVMLSWLIFSEWLAIIEEKNNAPLLPVILILLTLWAVTIKLSTLPLLLAALFLWWQFFHNSAPLDKGGMSRQRQGGLRTALQLLALAAILFLPWAIRSLILSGYLVYPGLPLDPFHFDWRIPAEAVRRESAVITAWARFSAGEIQDVLAMSLPEWVNAWFHNQTPNRQFIFQLIIAAPIGYALLLGLLAWLKRGLFNPTWQSLKRIALPLLAAYAGIAFWFFKAPFFRFGYAFLIPALLLWLLPLIQLIGTNRLQTLRLPLILLLLLIAFQGSVLVRSFEPATLTDRLVQPADYVNLPTAPCDLHNTRVWCAEQFNVCGYERFPCVPGADPLVAARGPHLSDGFRHLDVP
jgi:hypothetical protein